MRAPGMATPAQTARASTAVGSRAERRRNAKLSAALVALLHRFRSTLTSDERASFEEQVTDDRARSLGTDAAARDVVAELVRLVTVLAPWLFRSELSPFGPLRARYALELAQATLATVEAGAAAPTTGDAAGVEALAPRRRRRAVRTLSTLTSRSDVKAAIDAALDAKGTLTKRAREHEQTLARVEHVREHASQRMRDDAGLTDAVLAALEDEALAALDTQEGRRDAARARQVLRSDVAVPCGRLLVELRQLAAAARDHHADNTAVPSVSSRYAATRPSRKTRPAAAPQTAPQSAPHTDH